MSHSNFEGETKNFTSTAILSFVVVFVFLVLFSRCHGGFHPGHSGDHQEKTAVEKSH
ncbi:MAG: hypothetical protein LC122_07170 [Chitinophagales bacterium]|nr:hypothetical protein [Chitinophagales bacterium]